MVKVAAPALSLEASGSIGKTLVFSRWKGRPYVRTLVTPANPRSDTQRAVRASMRFLSQAWDDLLPGALTDWSDLALAANYSEFNAYVSHNMRRNRDNLAPRSTPDGTGGTAPSAPTVAVTGGHGNLAVTITHGTNLANWGFRVFAKLGSAPTGIFSELQAEIPADGAGDGTCTLLNLIAGDWHCKAVGFMKTGTIGTLSADDNDTVT